MPVTARPACYRFERAELSPAQHRLVVDGRITPLAGRAFDLLLLLVERAGELVAKDEIFDRVWPGVVVEENNLQVQVSALRKLLGPGAIETVAGHGYRFVPKVTLTEEIEPARNLRRTNLPRQLTSFVAREGRVAECFALLDHTCLLTLTGGGGLGKTRLSLEMANARADAYADGVWFVDLAPVTDGERVAEAVALVLGVAEQAVDRLLDIVQRFVKDRRLLLILDNCEHVLVGCAAVAKRLLQTSENLRIVATSREPLHIAGETVYPLSPLSLPSAGETVAVDALAHYEAIRLFVDRAQAAQPSFALTEQNASLVREICAHLDGIPLAIELAAARARALSLDAIAQRLDDRFRLLKSADTTAPTRQQTLKATIAWSYDLLTRREQAVLQRLAVFAGGWMLESAEAVCGGGDVAPEDVLDLHSNLIEKSLVTVEGDGSRYGLLESVREYAQECLVAAGDGDETRTRHLEFHAALAETAEPHLIGPEEDAWLARFDLERQNLLAAYEWSRKIGERGCSAALRMVHGSRRWLCRGAFDLGRPMLAHELSLSRTSASGSIRCRGLVAAAFLSYYAASYDDTRRLGKEAISLAQEIGDAMLAADAMGLVGSGYLGDDRSTARAYLEQSLVVSREASYKVVACDAVTFLGELESTAGNLEQAERYYKDALALAHALGSRVFTMAAVFNLGRVSLSRRSTDRAVTLLREALALAGETASTRHAAYFLAFCAALAASLGELRRAARYHGASQRHFGEMISRLEPADEHALAPLLAVARQAMDPAAFASAEEAGFALRREDALAELRTWLTAIADRASGSSP